MFRSRYKEFIGTYPLIATVVGVAFWVFLFVHISIQGWGLIQMAIRCELSYGKTSSKARRTSLLASFTIFLMSIQ